MSEWDHFWTFSTVLFDKGIFNICQQGNLNIFNKFASGIYLPHTLNLRVLLEDNLLTRVEGWKNNIRKIILDSFQLISR